MIITIIPFSNHQHYSFLFHTNSRSYIHLLLVIHLELHLYDHFVQLAHPGHLLLSLMEKSSFSKINVNFAFNCRYFHHAYPLAQHADRYYG